MVLYATPWLVYGIRASVRGHQEDNGLWLMGFAGVLIGVVLLGIRRPRLAGWLLVVPAVVYCAFIVPVAFAYDSATGALALVLVLCPLLAGVLLVAGRRERRHPAETTGSTPRSRPRT